MKRMIAAALAAALGLSALPAQAEGQLRIAEQFGIVYLLLNVAQEQKLIEKHGKAEGIDIRVQTVQLSGGPAINEALLSGSIDVAGAGVGPLLTLWDKTRGRQNVRGIASLGNFPYYLTSSNPAVRTIADFSDKDRIALPAVGVSVQARILQLASARQWGDAQYNRLDRLQVALPHPEATAALIKGGTEINAHFGNPPFQEQGLAGNPAVHKVLSSYDVLGGPASATVLYTTEKFRAENPKTYKAFVAALAEAADFITRNPEQAADIYQRNEGSKVPRELLLKVIRNPEVQFKIAPQNTSALAEFMHRVGAIKNKPASVKDYFFDDPHNASGS
ncbi:ABC transporter substrate-binding protein [Roseateles depolymerans]|uniref:ABC-type nitrate/sulfonate/bicarbonate transport system, periplasmic component n=1 Tax=Roseateles depolymerans TaxID=76731 RepID=A0A0U3N7N3_9BURK|nr:ABC transporter substrate-binding protein [Roseateles depolymerans]ALV04576.1 ABC-type nitrate/sulfonate/bicarbonate transport system, periplasmic component [Roseateles depolymerans]REG14108.1 NitT/TauT family transport system substrate-binding protein [Roseateles depolymerans]